MNDDYVLRHLRREPFIVIGLGHVPVEGPCYITIEDFTAQGSKLPEDEPNDGN